VSDIKMRCLKCQVDATPKEHGEWNVWPNKCELCGGPLSPMLDIRKHKKAQKP